MLYVQVVTHNDKKATNMHFRQQKIKNNYATVNFNVTFKSNLREHFNDFYYLRVFHLGRFLYSGITDNYL